MSKLKVQVLTLQVSDMDIFDADVTSLQLANMCNGSVTEGGSNVQCSVSSRTASSCKV